MMGGRYRNVMPSDLFKRGALARGSLPAPGKQYASENFREELRILMRRYIFPRKVRTTLCIVLRATGVCGVVTASNITKHAAAILLRFRWSKLPVMHS